MNDLLDYLFYHCYFWARANDEDAKKSIACHTMFFCLIPIGPSLLGIFSLFMPKKFVIVIAVVLGLGFLIMYEDLYNRYDNCKLRREIIKKYKPPTFIKFLFVVFTYMLVCSLPAILISVFR